jgi:hypothetical protein
MVMVLVAMRELETSRRGWLEKVVSCLPWHRYNTDTTPLTTISYGIPRYPTVSHSPRHTHMATHNPGLLKPRAVSVQQPSASRTRPDRRTPDLTHQRERLCTRDTGCIDAATVAGKAFSVARGIVLRLREVQHRTDAVATRPSRSLALCDAAVRHAGARERCVLRSGTGVPSY